MVGLKIAPGVTLPIDYVTKTAAILAQRRKGKTYTGAVLAEELVGAKLPFVALDPTGAWWGLRSSADGTSAGLPVVVIGGQHGDLPLERHSGSFIADLVLDHPGWYVLDLSLLETRQAERDFSLAFALRLYRRKMQPGMDFPLHLFVDEADLFVPQERETKGDNLVLGAFASIIRRGGLHGLGTTLISQRPALVNKGVLTQLDLLVLLRLVAGQDQDAIYRDYIKRHGTKEQQDLLMASLASLPVGDAWLYEPGADPPLFERVHIRERHTFNSSATPKAGEKRVEPKVFAAIDIEALGAQMAETVERAKENDPAELQRRLRAATDRAGGLEQQVEEWKTLAESRPAEEVIREVPIAIMAELDGAWGLLMEAKRTGEAFTEAIAGAARPLAEAILAAKDAADRKQAVERIAAAVDIPAARTSVAPPAAAPRAPAASPAPRAPSGDGSLGFAARGFLETLARLHPARVSVAQMATVAGRKPRGGSFNTAMKELREGDYVIEDGILIGLSARGASETGVESNVAMTGSQKRDLWLSVVPVASREILALLFRVHPAWLSVEEVAAELGRQPRGGSWNTALKILVDNNLVDRGPGSLRANDELFR